MRSQGELDVARPKDPSLVGSRATNVRLPRDLHDAAIARAQAEDRTFSQLVRVAIRRYLKEADDA